jgi:hypothetical protein
MNRDPRCVFVSHNMSEAVVTAAWLNERGVPAEVMSQATLGGLEGLTGWAPGVSLRGIEVWVDKAEDVPAARDLLVQHEAVLAERARAAEAAGPIQVHCEECDQSSVFPPSQIGSIQDCPHCGAYIDVEAPGSDTDGEDYAEGAEEEQ